MSFSVPINSDFDDYDFTISLDGTVYLLSVRWNGRMNKWFISIALENGTEIIGMRPIIADFPPFARFRNNNLPAGELIFIDTSGENRDPDRTDLGSRVILMYLEESDIAS